MYKGGRPQNSIWEFFLYVVVGNKKYAKYDHQQAINAPTQNVQWIQFHQHHLSEYFPSLEIFTLKWAIF